MYDLHSILIQLKKEDTPLHGVMVRCVRCFYQWLDPTLWEGSALFELWAQELELIYGDLRQRLSPNAKTDAGSLGDRFGFDTPPELPRLLQSIQTFYSVLIKFIAWNTLRGATPEPPLTELFSGRAFVNRGIRNFCGDDWYIWPLDIWDPALETQCEELRACLESFDTCPEGSTLSPDSLSRIYETVVPPALRHALGEYYTPGWLAERTLQNAVSASGRQAGDLRFLDPACGSGVFLIQALRMIRADTPQGPPLSDQVAGFDLHPLAVLTAKVNYLAVMACQPLPEAGLFLPVYRYDALNIPILRGDTLVIDTGCGLVCDVPLSLCRQAVEMRPDPEEFLSMPEARGLLTSLPPNGRLLLAGILLNRIWAFFHQKADIVMGNPPWVNWEYLSPRYRAGSQHLWGEYGLLQVKAPGSVFPRRMCLPCSPVPRWTAFSSPVGASVLSCGRPPSAPPRTAPDSGGFIWTAPVWIFGCWRWKTLAASGPLTGSVPLLRWYSSSGMPATFSLSPTGTGRQGPASGGRSGHRTRRLPPFFPLCGWRT